MAEVKWTLSQKQAIDARDCTLLVSAAAGSGKTAVLTERIIEKLRDTAGKADLSRMLIVTFTNAAAKELKVRIAKKLSEALESDPLNKHLAKQLSSISSAKICTVDSFCLDIVKGNFDSLGLPAKMRIADETEVSLLKNTVMNDLFDTLYADKETFADFESFTDIFIKDRDDSLPELFLKFYNKLSSYARGVDLVEEFALMLEEEKDKPFFEGRYGSFIKEYTTAFIDTYLPCVREYTAHFATTDGCPPKSAARYHAAFSDMLRILEALKDALEANDMDRAHLAVRDFEEAKMNGTRLTGEPDAVYIKGVKNNFDSDMQSIRDSFFIYTGEDVRACYSDTAKLLRRLHRLLTVFDKSFTAEKRRRRILDFSDVERYALELLYKDGAPTELALSYGKRFDEIYIDEYQDINELQDTVFRSIAGSAHRFMVGDIKQSIYGFRGAAPTIFADYRDTFPPYSDSQVTGEATIFLSNNFRCAEPVVKFCNAIFETVMNNSFGGVQYLPEDNLVYSKSEDFPVTDPTEVILVPKPKDGAPGEPQVVAARIEKLLKAGYRAKDIVILLRSPKSSAARFEAALSGINVPCYNADNAGFFENPEVLLALCLLNIIDNPRRDIYLAGALKSPVFGFTLDELELMRKAYPKGYLYDALCAWAQDNPHSKADYFFSFLEEMRRFARTEPIDKLIWHLYTETSLPNDVYGNAGADESRRANLMMLYEHARRFESGSFKGLYNFIRYIGEVIDRDARIEEAKTQTDEQDAVRIMSVHASKGLEFKVCFLCCADKPFKSEKGGDDILLDAELGIGTYTEEPSGIARVNGILRKTIQEKAACSAIAEEMRILYVALTRAVDRLIVTAQVGKTDTLFDKCAVLNKLLSPYMMHACNNYITMILTALEGKQGVPYTLHTVSEEEIAELADGADEKGETVTALPETPDYDTCKREIDKRFSFKYPLEEAARLPSKLSVSRLYPAILDEEETADTSASMLPRPSFLDGKEKAGAAERGTATHVFMQFCDFDAVKEHGVDAEIERLIAKRFIPESYRDLIHRDKLAGFFESGLFERMCASGALWREKRFNITLPASRFTEDGERGEALEGESILVQGVIDCFFEEADGSITVVDYKTDRFTEAQKKDPEACAAILRERHGTQLGYYRTAVELLTGKKPGKTVIYAFDLGKEIIL